MFFSSSVQSADPNYPLLIWNRVPRRHSEQANGSKGGDASQDLRPLCLQELEEGAYRHGELNHVATPSLNFELQEAMSRWLFNFHHHFYDDECNGEMSMNMIVRTKVFQLKCKKENQCLLRLESLLLASSPHPAQYLVFKGPERVLHDVSLHGIALPLPWRALHCRPCQSIPAR